MRPFWLGDSDIETNLSLYPRQRSVMINATAIYTTPEKNQVHEIIVKAVTDAGITIERAFTMPAVEARCAAAFKKAFGCHVTGIDFSPDLVRKFDNPNVDEIFRGNVFDLANHNAVFQKPVLKPTIDGQGAMGCAGKHLIPGDFDLMFLDYTSLLSWDKAAVTTSIITAKANNPALIAVTFVHPREMSLREETEILDSIWPTDIAVHRYKNVNPVSKSTSDMILATLVRK